MQANSYSKYVLRDLHEAIDLFDRKIDYCQTTEKFDNSEERAKALQKLSSKRGALVKTAMALRALGVESGNSFLPRSFKDDVENSCAVLPEQTETAAGTRRRAARG
jgi:hypothetical protein